MKTKTALLFLCSQLIACVGFVSNKPIQGNGQVITREFSIADYEEIVFVGSALFEYEQSDKFPSLSITLDENLFDYLVVSGEGKTLKIYPKEENRQSSYQIQPTTFKIQSSSRALKALNQTGSGAFVVNSPLTTDKLEIRQAGSGEIRLNGRLTGQKLDCKVAGSGSLSIVEADIETLECGLSGSGRAEIKGKTDQAEYSVAGSGLLEAHECEARQVECSVAGNGQLQTYAQQKLDASVVGSGRVYYKGSPAISQSTVGSGMIKKMD